MAGMIDEQTITRMLLTALGETDVEGVMERLEMARDAEGEEITAKTPRALSGEGVDTGDTVRRERPEGAGTGDEVRRESPEGMVEAARELREAIRGLIRTTEALRGSEALKGAGDAV